MSDDSAFIPEVLHEAAKIFLAELNGHAEFIHSLRTRLAGAPPADTEKLLTENAGPLAERFHLIKGGAGFLKLTALKDNASQNEKLFRARPLDIGAAATRLEEAETLLNEQIAGLAYLN